MKKERKISVITWIILVIIIVAGGFLSFKLLNKDTKNENFTYITKKTKYMLVRKIPGEGKIELNIEIPKGYKYVNSESLSSSLLVIFSEDNCSTVTLQIKTGSEIEYLENDIKEKYETSTKEKEIVKEYSVNNVDNKTIVEYGIKSGTTSTYTTHIVVKLEENVFFTCEIFKKGNEITSSEIDNITNLEYLGIKQ